MREIQNAKLNCTCPPIGRPLRSGEDSHYWRGWQQMWSRWHRRATSIRCRRKRPWSRLRRCSVSSSHSCAWSCLNLSEWLPWLLSCSEWAGLLLAGYTGWECGNKRESRKQRGRRQVQRIQAGRRWGQSRGWWWEEREGQRSELSGLQVDSASGGRCQGTSRRRCWQSSIRSQRIPPPRRRSGQSATLPSCLAAW